MFKLTVAPQARRDLRKLPIKYRRWVVSAIRELREDAFLGKPLKREYTGKYSLKVGPYRVIYKVERKEKQVFIITIGHRAVIYD